MFVAEGCSDNQQLVRQYLRLARGEGVVLCNPLAIKQTDQLTGKLEKKQMCCPLINSFEVIITQLLCFYNKIAFLSHIWRISASLRAHLTRTSNCTATVIRGKVYWNPVLVGTNPCDVGLAKVTRGVTRWWRMLKLEYRSKLHYNRIVLDSKL
ncbi:hypothetical protein J6590_073032 [Homalodisca vitripennis]|nr:hypothetical protein J6590_073032 [Homalodisca vitripennis]